MRQEEHHELRGVAFVECPVTLFEDFLKATLKVLDTPFEEVDALLERLLVDPIREAPDLTSGFHLVPLRPPLV